MHLTADPKQLCTFKTPLIAGKRPGTADRQQLIPDYAPPEPMPSLCLDFIPLEKERYDLVIPRVHYESDLLRPLLDLIRAPYLRRVVAELPGYDTTLMGEVVSELKAAMAALNVGIRNNFWQSLQRWIPARLYKSLELQHK